MQVKCLALHDPEEHCQSQMRRQLPFPGSAKQGITDYTGKETFAKDPRLAKLLRELSRSTCGTIKKVHWLSRMSVSLNLLRFGALLRNNL